MSEQITGEELLKFIPQRIPMVMIDTIIEVEEESALCALTIKEDNTFCSEEGLFEETGLIEHIAQSAAAMVGYDYYKKSLPAPIGFIASVDKMELFFNPKAGSVIETKITTLQKVSEIVVVNGVVTGEGAIVAKCNMKFYIKQ